MIRLTELGAHLTLHYEPKPLNRPLWTAVIAGVAVVAVFSAINRQIVGPESYMLVVIVAAIAAWIAIALLWVKAQTLLVETVFDRNAQTITVRTTKTSGVDITTLAFGEIADLYIFSSRSDGTRIDVLTLSSRRGSFNIAQLRNRRPYSEQLVEIADRLRAMTELPGPAPRNSVMMGLAATMGIRRR
ncbi:hypothetical protein [Flaviflagellibacter deserti]|uniref:DUF304 domain-containing protein n=1 Tax=Flaviflagellibacter deserti TaxID=2267266 RepID=A0ABV9YXI3_9HYPH